MTNYPCLLGEEELELQLRKDVEYLLGSFSSGNSIPVEKVTLTTNFIKDLFEKHFPDHEWIKK